MKILDRLFNKKPKMNIKIEILDCPDKEHLMKHINRIVEYFYEKFPDNGKNCSQSTNNHGKVKGITDIKVSYSENYKPIGLKDKQIISDSEENGIPVFIFTAKDKLSTNQIVNYAQDCKEANCSKRQIKGVNKRIDEFLNYQTKNNTKLPD